MYKGKKVSFPIFFLAYAAKMGWDVPNFQLETCEFLQEFLESEEDKVGVLMLHRGAGKSTMLDIFNAYVYYTDNDALIFHQGATDSDANKCSRGTAEVLEQHPLTWKITKDKGETVRWWIKGAKDKKYGSFYAKGILSNVTGARSTFIQNDDVEVPSNTDTEEKREKLRFRLTEQTHILIPDGKKLFVGTPHTTDSLYEEQIRKGAKHLVKKMFADEARFTSGELVVKVGFKPYNLFSGIGEHARFLEVDKDYTYKQVKGKMFEITLKAKHMLLDVYGEAMWKERFTPSEMAHRRKECNAIGEWDSQYQMHSVSITEVRLDSNKLVEYEDEVDIKISGQSCSMWLAGRQIVSATLKLDPSSGKTKSDVSSTALVLSDEAGRLYWHRSIPLTGEIVTTSKDGKDIVGGQVWQLVDIIEEFKLPRIVIETNGVGTHVPSILRSCLKQRGIACGVTEQHESTNKNKRIIGAIETPLISGYLYVHKSVKYDMYGKRSAVMKKFDAFNPAVTNNKDDELDSLAGAINAEPIRVGLSYNEVQYTQQQHWGSSPVMLEMQVEDDWG